MKRDDAKTLLDQHPKMMVSLQSLCAAMAQKKSSMVARGVRLDVYEPRPTNTVVTTVRHSFGTLDEQEPLLAERAAAGWEPYMMVAVTSETGHSRKIVCGSWAVAADVDNGLPELFESNELISPSFVVTTSPGRHHAVWILDASCTSVQMQYLAAVIQDRFGADPAFVRTNQAVRLPGFVNYKIGHKVKLHVSGKQTALLT